MCLLELGCPFIYRVVFRAHHERIRGQLAWHAEARTSPSSPRTIACSHTLAAAPKSIHTAAAQEECCATTQEVHHADAQEEYPCADTACFGRKLLLGSGMFCVQSS